MAVFGTVLLSLKSEKLWYLEEKLWEVWELSSHNWLQEEGSAPREWALTPWSRSSSFFTQFLLLWVHNLSLDRSKHTLGGVGRSQLPSEVWDIGSARPWLPSLPRGIMELTQLRSMCCVSCSMYAVLYRHPSHSHILPQESLWRQLTKASKWPRRSMLLYYLVIS